MLMSLTEPVNDEIPGTARRNDEAPRKGQTRIGIEEPPPWRSVKSCDTKLHSLHGSYSTPKRVLG